MAHLENGRYRYNPFLSVICIYDASIQVSVTNIFALIWLLKLLQIQTAGFEPEMI